MIQLLVITLQHLEIKKISEQKKSALAAQFAAEATLRRVHAAQKDDQMPPLEAIIAPLEAELKLARQEVMPLLIQTTFKLIDPGKSLQHHVCTFVVRCRHMKRTMSSVLELEIKIIL